jgi:transposase
LIGDKAYDSDPLDTQLQRAYALDLIAPHKDNRVRPATQDGRALRRYQRRWVVERFFAWLHNSRRLVVRWERYVENFEAMIHLACARILLRAL